MIQLRLRVRGRIFLSSIFLSGQGVAGEVAMVPELSQKREVLTSVFQLSNFQIAEEKLSATGNFGLERDVAPRRLKAVDLPRLAPIHFQGGL